MKVLKIYDGKTRMYPSGIIATKERVLSDYPAVEMFTHVISTDENDETIYSLHNLSFLRTTYDIPKELNDEEAVAKIQEIMNTPPDPVESMSTTEERIAAALEYQNLLSL